MEEAIIFGMMALKTLLDVAARQKTGGQPATPEEQKVVDLFYNHSLEDWGSLAPKSGDINPGDVT